MRAWPANRALCALLLVVTTVLISGCGSSQRSSGAARNTVPSRGPGTLSVSPTHPNGRSAITFAFTAPASSGVSGHEVFTYSLSVTGTSEPSCVGAHESAMPSIGRGARDSLTLGPGQLHRPWCSGHYSGRVIELARAHCTGNAPCPQYIRVVAIVARATFDVARS